MAEDSQYKGELWNKRAIKLLNLFSWDMIGDSGMDLEGSDGEKYGIDSLYSFKDPAKDIPESLILEAKSYKTTSFSKSKLQEWIDRLNIKILELRNSEYLIERFPIFKDISTLKIGLIFIWFDDIENYKEYRQKFLEILSEIKVSSRTFRNGVYNKIYVIDNDLISKLCSLYTVVREFNENFKFYYPSAFIHERAVQRSAVLSLDYFFSKFILGQLKSSGKRYDTNIVFYWGELDVRSFEMLKSILKSYSFVDQEFKLVIYKYKRDDDEFRKILPQIKKSYENENIEFDIKDMNSCTELPIFIIND
ncbi:hypothetical protein [Parabacteroides distasonis]|uniref:hypothetical protein n=1 Tax=Parabacteroides distasonis TaxID=823 RepID=UPI001BDEBBA6|nr:hypothetical protein [Parabacteroides distasonis]MBT1282186.1 hypothetical protein [Parabacteroides distasonis]UVR97180.1 hypothetical protein NXX79_06640 [Parabacteroides distasonis]